TSSPALATSGIRSRSGSTELSGAGRREERATAPMLEHQVGVHPDDLVARGQFVEDETLELARRAGGHVREEVVRPGQVVDRADLGQRQQVLDERVDQLPPVRADLDEQERLQRPPEL